MISPIYCLGTHGLWAYLIRRTAGGFVLGLLVWPAVAWIRRRMGR
jgi:hypothetical protein